MCYTDVNEHSHCVRMCLLFTSNWSTGSAALFDVTPLEKPPHTMIWMIWRQIDVKYAMTSIFVPLVFLDFDTLNIARWLLLYQTDTLLPTHPICILPPHPSQAPRSRGTFDGGWQIWYSSARTNFFFCGNLYHGGPQSIVWRINHLSDAGVVGHPWYSVSPKNIQLGLRPRRIFSSRLNIRGCPSTPLPDNW